ncbi:Aspergillopepsin-2 [Colletotrichum sidae]|uniref:Aspergillopepsin-2 n=1 Tax=Colletotrichum sidae TaxID=1347389 RepID=A0A4R8T5P4_9PEZI|nr:Aspergillopepsin-2 [Colletotrichum sidae]
MKFILFLAAAAAGLVSAAPGAKLVQRNYSPVVPRSSRARLNSAPIQRLSVDSLESTDGVKNNDFSSNWAGAVKIGTGYNHVTGTIVVPDVSGARGSAASAWVGIDGDTCQTAILQTGISFYADGTFDAWYEWIPDYAYSFSNFGVSVGDKIRITVDASSKTRGVATLENLTTGKKSRTASPAPRPASARPTPSGSSRPSRRTAARSPSPTLVPSPSPTPPPPALRVPPVLPAVTLSTFPSTAVVPSWRTPLSAATPSLSTMLARCCDGLMDWKLQPVTIDVHEFDVWTYFVSWRGLCVLVLL